MTSPPFGPKDSRTLTALTELARDSVERPTTVELDQGLDTLLARIAVGRAQRRRFLRWSLVGATAALCIVVGLQVVSVARQRLPDPAPPALAYQIRGGSVLEGGYLRESGHSGIKLLFNEGTKFELNPGTRGRLRAVDKEGARVAIEHGTASFEVTPSSDRRWLVEVGPFLVAVKGTVFTVSWDASSERFELRLRHGRVVVSGPVSGGDLALRWPALGRELAQGRDLDHRRQAGRTRQRGCRRSRFNCCNSTRRATVGRERQALRPERPRTTGATDRRQHPWRAPMGRRFGKRPLGPHPRGCRTRWHQGDARQGLQ